MNDQADIERLLADRLTDSGRVLSPPGSVDKIITQARRTRPRPRWLAILKEPPMRHRSRVAVGSPTARVAALAAVTMLVAILGAGALVAGAQPSPSPAPPEVSTTMQPAWVTGTSRPPLGQRTRRTRNVDGVESEFELWTDIPIEMSDPRLSGTLSQVITRAEHPVASDAPIVVFSGQVRIENERGSWEGTGVAMERGLFRDNSNTTITDTGVLVGSGFYEG